MSPAAGSSPAAPLRDESECPIQGPCKQLPSKPEMAASVLREIASMTLRRRVGDMALCASGGGITGFYFEMGALKCLEDCCSPGALNELWAKRVPFFTKPPPPAQTTTR